MKKVVYLFMLVAAIALNACTKDDSDSIPKGYEVIDGVLYPQTPDWMYSRIDSMRNDSAYSGSQIDLYYWADAFYYLINIPSEKTRGRYLYRVDGTRVVIESEVLRDFYFHRVFKLKIWSDYRAPHTPNLVEATLNTGFTFEQVLSFVYEQPVTNTSLKCYFTTSKLDSLESLREQLLSKNYLTSCYTRWTSGDSLITVKMDFSGIKSQSVYSDWNSTVKRFGLKYASDSLTNTVFYVPGGEELEWTKRLYSYECVKSTK